MKLRKLFTATLSILLIVALTGCGGSKSEAGTTPDKTSETDASELMNLYDSISADTKYVALSDLPEITAKESYTIGVAMTDVSTGWFKALYDHVNEKLTEAGVKVNLVQCNDDAAMQVDQINTFIAQGVDAIIINPANPQETVTSALDDCAAAGIPVVAVDTPPEAGAAYMTACVTDAYSLGKMVGTELATHMLGKTLGAMYVTRGKIRSEQCVLEVEGLTNDVIKDVSFKLREGEILGIAGLVNSGRTETARAIMGVDKLKSGTIKINGVPVKIKNPTDAVRHGLFLAPEDRKAQAMVLCRPIRENISLSKLSSVTNRLGILNSKKEAETIDNLVRALKVKMNTIESPVQDLSGGNQQKIVIAKALTAQPNILIFDEPTQGIDVGARAEIYGLLEKLRADGKSIILISSETEEIQGTCDRTIVMRSGHVTGELNAEEMKDTKLMLQYMYKDV